MRHVLVVALALSFAAPAAAQDFGSIIRLPRFQLTPVDVLDVPLTPFMPQATTPSIVLPPRYGFALDDGRAFWFAAGASSVVALGTHVLVGIPTLFIGGAAATTAGAQSPATQLPMMLGISSAYVL